MPDSVKSFAKFFVNDLVLHRLGLEVRGVPPKRAKDKLLEHSDTGSVVDLTDVTDIHPISIVCESIGRPTLVRVPLEKCRHFLWSSFPCREDSLSPFIRTIADYEKGYCQTYRGSALEAFYRAFQPTTAAQVLGLADLTSRVLHETLPVGAPVMWTPGGPQEKAKARAEIVEEENMSHGEEIPYAAGDKYFGPVSQSKGELEFNRLINVYESIKRDGFKVSGEGRGNIGVAFMLSGRDDDWRCKIWHGHHRIAALSALNYDTAIVQLRGIESLGGIIQREDARYWPAVRNGYLTGSEATAIFDRMFAGRHQPQLRFANGRAVPDEAIGAGPDGDQLGTN